VRRKTKSTIKTRKKKNDSEHKHLHHKEDKKSPHHHHHKEEKDIEKEHNSKEKEKKSRHKSHHKDSEKDKKHKHHRKRGNSTPKEKEKDPVPTGPMYLTVESGCKGLQGKRPTMEDAHIVFNKFTEIPDCKFEKNGGIWAVYDGHGGQKVAKIVQEKLHTFIINDPAWAEGKYEEALTSAFIKTDQYLLEEAARGPHFKDGTTVVLSVIIDNILYCANVGDSECVLGRRNGKGWESILLSEKHVPTTKEERSRIDAAGGCIFAGRLFGTLAVSRALGDIDLKKPKQPEDYVSPIPKVFKTELTPYDKYFILACDGLWGKFTYQDAVEYTDNLIQKGKTVQEISELISQDALDRGSLDNITTIILHLDWKPIIA